MLTVEEWVLCGNRLQQFGSRLELDPEPIREIGPVANNHCNNQGAFTLVTTGISKAQTKHISICYRNSQDLQKHRIVKDSNGHTNKNVPDILINALTKVRHRKFTNPMGLW
jgi:hypothetical protein